MRRTPFAPGAGHALELRYLFDMGGAPPLDPAQRVLSEQMIDYWSSFVATGSPETEGQPHWPAFDADRPERMSLQPEGSTLSTDFAARHQCAFWSSRG